MTTAPAVDTRDHAAAIKAAINTELGDDVAAYQYDEVPGSTAQPADNNDGAALVLPPIYVVFDVERRTVPNQRSTGQSGRSGWRVTVKSVGTTINEARWAQLRVTRALEEQVLTIGAGDTARTTTRIQHEDTTDPELDDGRYTGSNTLVYVV